MSKKHEYAMLIFVTIWLYPHSEVLMAKELPVIWQENSGGTWWKRGWANCTRYSPVKTKKAIFVLCGKMKMANRFKVKWPRWTNPLTFHNVNSKTRGPTFLFYSFTTPHCLPSLLLSSRVPLHDLPLTISLYYPCSNTYFLGWGGAE